MTATIRRLHPSEAPALAVFGEACFREAFARNFLPEGLDRLCPRVFERSVMEGLIEQGTWLAEDAEGWLGYLACGDTACPIPQLEPPTQELARLYVLQRGQGRGVADPLMTCFLEEAIRRGCRSLWLQAFEGSPRALAFYRRWGFQDFGPFTVECEGLVLPHRALGRNLSGM